MVITRYRTKLALNMHITKNPLQVVATDFFCDLSVSIGLIRQSSGESSC